MRRRAVTPIEVEDVLYAHPAIEDVAVVAKPDPKWGETPIAFVDLKPPLTPGADAAPSVVIGRSRASGSRAGRPGIGVSGV